MCVQFSEDGSLLAAGCGDGIVRLFNPSGAPAARILRTRFGPERTRPPLAWPLARPDRQRFRNALASCEREGESERAMGGGV